MTVSCTHLFSLDFRLYNSEIVCTGCGTIWSQTKGESIYDFPDLDCEVVRYQLHDGALTNPDE